MPGTGENLCVIIGNEARGMSEVAAELCDFLVRIPIYGKAESLNAAVAAGILLYRCKEEDSAAQIYKTLAGTFGMC